MSIVIILGTWFMSSIVGGILIGRFIARTQNPCPPVVDSDISRIRRPTIPLQPSATHISLHED